MQGWLSGMLTAHMTLMCTLRPAINTTLTYTAHCQAKCHIPRLQARRPSAEDSPPSTAYIILRTLWACKASG